MGLTHFDEAPVRDRHFGHLQGRWTFLGEGAGSVDVGARRIEIPAGGWSTPAHEHGRSEEIFYVVHGRGLSWQDGRTAEVRAGDCIVYLAGKGAHSLHALEPLDVLAFGPREYDESVGFPRLGMSLVRKRAVESVRAVVDGAPIQFVREAEAGAPELPAEVGPRPSTIVNVDDIEARRFGHGRVTATRRNLGRAAGSVNTGIQHAHVEPGRYSAPQHCHSQEEEMFVILDGDGVLLLGDEESPVRHGSVVARPAGSGVAHAFRAGAGGLTYLAYGTRRPGDICFYPRSSKLAFRGLGVVARIERLDYWDGEE